MRFLLLAIVLAITCVLPAGVSAVEFVIVGPRAVGMGGAGVAVTDDALATYWNPAGMALKNTIDIRAQAGAHGKTASGSRTRFRTSRTSTVTTPPRPTRPTSRRS